MCLTSLELVAVKAVPRTFLGKTFNSGIAFAGVERKKGLGFDHHRRPAFGGFVGEIEKSFFNYAEIRLISIEYQIGVVQENVPGLPLFLTHRAGLEGLFLVAVHFIFVM